MTQLKMSVADFLSGYGLMHDDTTATDRQTAVIVALPRAMDSVRLVGDEEKHATLLFFGETSSLPEEAKTTLVNTLEQASQMFSPFSEMINDVSRLGSDTPPALVAKLSGRNLSQIRDVLQINPKFGEYMANAPQHPQYTPHVTLGYPDYQGESAIRDSVRQIYRIQFDRLALWWNDERIEFPLGVNLDMGPEGELMTEPAAADGYLNHVEMYEGLVHSGVKGMKWGVHKDHLGVSNLSTFRVSGGVVQTVPLTKKAERNPFGQQGAKSANAVMNVSRALTDVKNGAFSPKGPVSVFNKSWREAGKFKDSTLRDEYDTKLAKLLTDAANKHTKMGTHARVHMVRRKDNDLDVVLSLGTRVTTAGFHRGLKKSPVVDVVHADSSASNDVETQVFSAVLDKDGLVIGLKPKNSLAHAIEVLENFLAHHGIKGMKWGIRRDLSSGGGGGSKAQAKAAKTDAKVEKKAAASTRASLASMKSGSVVTMLDGDGNPKTMVKKKDGSWQETFLSADAERMVRTAQKEGHELSTREVQEALNRANAINNYEKIFGNDPNAQLRQQVDAMRLQKEFAQMKAEMTPQKKSAVSKLVGATSTAFSAYSTLDKAVGGSISKQLGVKLTEKLDPAGFATSVAKSALKDQNESTMSTAKAQKALSEAAKASAEAQIAVLNLKNKTGKP